MRLITATVFPRLPATGGTSFRGAWARLFIRGRFEVQAPRWIIAGGGEAPYAGAMPKPAAIELPGCEAMPILYEDRAVMAIDKPPGWMLVPFSWQDTRWNLQAAITSSIAARHFWARSRSLRYLRYVHRLDAETSGVLLLAKSPGALRGFSAVFESRQMEKLYLAVVLGVPHEKKWVCRLPLGPDPSQPGRMKVDPKQGKSAETHFVCLETAEGPGRRAVTLLEVRPLTGRTHQIRLHLAAAGFPVLGDPLYGKATVKAPSLGLRAVRLAYEDPFCHRRVQIEAPRGEFLERFGFKGSPPRPQQVPMTARARRPS